MTTIVVPAGRLGITREFELEDLPHNSLVWAVTNGMKQGTVDAYAPIKRDKYKRADGTYDDESYMADSAAAWNDKFDRILAGEPPGARVASRPESKRAKQIKAAMAQFESLSDDEFAAVLARFQNAA